MQEYINPYLRLEEGRAVEGMIRWKSPSNIAIVKYWGKFGQQLPRNPSISFTLQNAITDTSLQYFPKTDKSTGITLKFNFEGAPKPVFEKKINDFLESLLPVFPFLQQLELHIHSTNSFPHSAGIASSASSMSALALCLCSLEQILFGTLPNEDAFLQKASFVARLGSGSACRSVFPLAAIWGASPSFPYASDHYAQAIGHHLHPVFQTMHDDILIVSKKEKSVSSRAGHQLMEGNPYADSRYRQAGSNIVLLGRALQQGDLETFGQIAESEALTLHALMMASKPPFILLNPKTIEIITMIQQYRADTRKQVFFTLDAGPNVHLLYPDEIHEDVMAFTRSELLPLCEDGMRIEDQAGPGPILVQG